MEQPSCSNRFQHFLIRVELPLHRHWLELEYSNCEGKRICLVIYWLASKQLGRFWRPVRCERAKGFGMLWSLAWEASPSKSTGHLKLDYRLEIALGPTMDLQHGFSCTMYWKLDDGILFELHVRFSNLILRNIIQTFCFFLRLELKGV